MKNKLQNILLILCSTLIIVITIFMVFGIKKISEPKNNNIKYMTWCRNDYDKYIHGQSSYNEDWMIKCIKRYRKIEKKSK